MILSVINLFTSIVRCVPLSLLLLLSLYTDIPS